MNFHTFGAEGRPSILLIHGGGNAWWNYLRQARRLAEDYHVIPASSSSGIKDRSIPF